MFYKRANFAWTQLLFKVMAIPFLTILILLLISQATKIQEGSSPQSPVELPVSENLPAEVPFYR